MYNRTPVMQISAFGDEQLAVRGIKEGAMDYLVKRKPGPWA